jgi:hypothetical protein
VIIILVLTTFLIVARSQKVPDKASLLMSVDMDGDADWKAAKATFHTGFYPYPTVGFVGDKIVFAFQHWKDNVAGSTEQEYKVREFELQSGKETTSHEWPVVHDKQRWDVGHLFPLKNGVLLFTGSKLALYSSEWKALWQTDFVGEVGVAPGGQVALLRSSIPGQVTDSWIDTNSSAEISSFTHLPDHYNSVGDRKLAFMVYRVPPGKGTVLIRSDSGAWATLCDCMGVPHFLNSHTAAIITAEELLVVDDGGALVFKSPLGSGNREIRVKSSLHANRFVLGGGKANVWPLADAMGSRLNMSVRVFDLDKKERVAEVALDTQDASLIDFALSEDGTKLATFNGSRLQIYALPPVVGRPRWPYLRAVQGERHS